MEITFLEAQGNIPLTKTYTLNNNKELVQAPYPLVSKVTSHTSEFKTLVELRTLCRAAASKGWCIIKGTPTRPLFAESRKGSHDQSADTELLVLDLDGVKGAKTVERFMKLMGMDDLQYLVQYSASMGVNACKGLSAHIYIMLSAPTSPLLLKQWLMHKNLTVPLLEEQLTMTASSRGIRWPLDVTVCQNDKLIFIADPICRNGVVDTLAGTKRWVIKNPKGKSFFTLDVSDFSGLPDLKQKKLRALRSDAGLNNRDATYNKDAAISNPDPTAVIAERLDGEYVRVNLANSPPSWGHWYNVMYPEVLFSFKDEEPVLLKKLDPSYYHKAVERMHQLKAQRQLEEDERQDSLIAEMGTKPDERTGLHYLAFIDDRSDDYYIGTYNPDKDEVDLRKTSSREKIDYYLGEHGQDIPDVIPRWRYEMKFESLEVFDPENKFINMYQPSEYIRNAKKLKNPRVPKTILSIIRHITNNDEEMVEHFLNWLACKLQLRIRVGTAWLFYGTQGTGKGTLFNYVLRPIFGKANTNVCLLSDIEGEHHNFIPNCVLRLIDEANAESSRSLKHLRSRLWNAITEETGTVNIKKVQQYEAVNYTDYFLASNATIPIDIDDADRRYNICQRQESPYPGKDRTQLRLDAEKEIQSFTNYLISREINLKSAQSPMANEAKSTLASQHLSTSGEFCHKILRGDIHFFLDFLPPDPRVAADEVGALAMYEEVMELIVKGKDDGKLFIHGEVSAMYLYLAERISSKSKFTMMLKKNGLIPKRMRRNGEGQAAIQAKWNVDDEAKARWNAYMTKKRAPMRAVK